MDYYQGVVSDYLTANRSIFVNPEFTLELYPEKRKPPKGTSWIIDILAVDVVHTCVYLCEVTYSKKQPALVNKLRQWATHWEQIKQALWQEKGAAIPKNWPIRPWIFLPQDLIEGFEERIKGIDLVPKITPLEFAAPWKYGDGHRKDEKTKEGIVSSEMW